MSELKARASNSDMLDNGPEMTAEAVRNWLGRVDVRTLYFEPSSPWENATRAGKTMDNGHIESFNGSVRDECLNTNWFETLDDARCGVQAWQREYNDERPHSSLGNVPPSAFAAQLQARIPEFPARRWT